VAVHGIVFKMTLNRLGMELSGRGENISC
jgi:hypothetical protein